MVASGPEEAGPEGLDHRPARFWPATARRQPDGGPARPDYRRGCLLLFTANNLGRPAVNFTSLPAHDPNGIDLPFPRS